MSRNEKAPSRPIDDLIERAKSIPQNTESATHKAKMTGLVRARELQKQGLFPSEDSPNSWTEEHDQRLHNLIKEVRKDFGLPYYPVALRERDTKPESR